MRVAWGLACLALLGCPKPAGFEAATEPWRAAPPPVDDAIYFVMVDRFANGDPDNDGAVDPGDPQAFHGGDLQGVIDHLDHLERLGVRTVWLSPVFQMRTEKFYDWGAFHGYWVQDPFSLEPRFGDEALLRQLSAELHARGMRLLLDVVWNHVSFDAPLRQQRPDFFHDLGGITDWNDPFQLVNGEVHGLPDLAQERPQVHAWLLDAARHWLQAAQPDGFRVDAVRHMPSQFLRQISAELQAEAGDGFLLLGEDFQGDPVALAETFEQGGFGAMFDFPMHYAMLDVFCDERHPGRLGTMLSSDGAYPDAQRLVTFLDNHDLPRVLSRCQGDLGGVRRALAFQLTTRGIPAFTWGLEAGLEGAEEPHNRADMIFDAGHPLEQDIVTLLDFRRRHPSISSGVTYKPGVKNRLMVYERLSARERAVIAVNGGSEPVPLSRDPARAGWMHPSEALLVEDELRLFDLSQGMDGFPSHLAPGGVAVVILGTDEGLPEGETVAGGLDYELPGAHSKRVLLRVQGAPLQAGDQLLLTGAGRALGSWDPGAPAGVFEAGPDGPQLHLEAPSETVLELKLVLQRADGSLVWQQGENRYVQVPAPVPEALLGPLGPLSEHMTTMLDVNWE